MPRNLQTFHTGNRSICASICFHPNHWGMTTRGCLHPQSDESMSHKNLYHAVNDLPLFSRKEWEFFNDWFQSIYTTIVPVIVVNTSINVADGESRYSGLSSAMVSRSSTRRPVHPLTLVIQFFLWPPQCLPLSTLQSWTECIDESHGWTRPGYTSWPLKITVHLCFTVCNRV